jgi:hypothetical protein
LARRGRLRFKAQYTRHRRLWETLLSPHRGWLLERAPQVNYSARILFQELRRERGYAGCYRPCATRCGTSTTRGRSGVARERGRSCCNPSALQPGAAGGLRNHGLLAARPGTPQLLCCVIEILCGYRPFSWQSPAETRVVLRMIGCGDLHDRRSLHCRVTHSLLRVRQRAGLQTTKGDHS